MSQDFNQSESINCKGPWPFITQRIYCRRDHLHVVWRSREHRKGLRRAKSGKLLTVSAVLLRCMWMPQQLNWWIGIVFAAGSLLFLLGSILSLTPGLATKWSLDATRINAIFFTGSIPFTTAAYLQLFQAANAGEFSAQGRQAPQRIVWFGWLPRNIGWLSCALQFPGTVLFNVKTFDAILPDLTWLQQDLVIWAPNFVAHSSHFKI